MRTRLVFWGKNDNEEKVLIGLNLNEEDSDIDVYVFPETAVTEDFVNQMQKNWRTGEELLFPDQHIVLKRPLGITQSMLPDGYSVDREDILKRAQTEWHFVVLSSKLHRAYESELEEFKERMQKLDKFDSGLWEELKGFWSKVQTQVREKNLFRDHANAIRRHTNDLFSEMKQMRKKLDEEFHEKSAKHMADFREKLDVVEKKVEEGLGLQPLFQELKDIQKKFRDTSFTREHRAQVWKQLDGLFKRVKKERFGKDAVNRGSALERIRKRYEGLLNAIEKMERSIKRDHGELDFQNKRIENAGGSLEAQIRAAKTTMIEERIRSKEEKLSDMTRTRSQLEKKIQQLEAKEAAEQEKERLKQAKQEVKAKIAEEIKAAEQEREEDPSVQKAVQTMLADGEEKADELIETIEEGFEDIIDTIKAVAAVIEDKVEAVVDSWEEE